MTKPADSNSTHDSTDQITWSSSKRLWVSLIVAFHLFCVALAPIASVDPRPGLAVATQQVLSPYSESLYLLHGYRFFAPEPGPSHIVQYELTKKSGAIVTGHFPNRGEAWPRLLYHRWFMLSETMFQHVSETLDQKQLGEWQKQINDQISELQKTNPRAADELQNQLRRELNQHERMSELRDRLVTSIGKNLLRKYDGTMVELTMATRVIPSPEDIAIGLKLDAKQYLPPELSYPMGIVYSDSDELETIQPPTPDGEEQGGGADKN